MIDWSGRRESNARVQLGKWAAAPSPALLAPYEGVPEAPVQTNVGHGTGHDLRSLFDFYRSHR